MAAYVPGAGNVVGSSRFAVVPLTVSVPAVIAPTVAGRRPTGLPRVVVRMIGLVIAPGSPRTVAVSATVTATGTELVGRFSRPAETVTALVRPARLPVSVVVPEPSLTRLAPPPLLVS